MSDAFAARCGIYCGECEYREKMNCSGCIAAAGKMFYGECELAPCCIEKGLEHCGQCSDFPCDKLRAYSYDEQQGDNGQRIRNLEAWNAMGFQAWLDGRKSG